MVAVGGHPARVIPSHRWTGATFYRPWFFSRGERRPGLLVESDIEIGRYYLDECFTINQLTHLLGDSLNFRSLWDL